MKIERVSDTQLKLTLTKADLAERDIKLEDLIRPGEKTQQLFRDIMEQAMEECDFITENIPLMVEAVPVGLDGIMIIVTKVESKDKNSNPTELFNQAKDLHRFKKKPLATEETETKEDDDLLVYSFSKLDDVIDLSIRLEPLFNGASSLYKNEGRYFLVMQGNTYTTEETIDDLETILDEYGQKHISTLLSKYYDFLDKLMWITFTFHSEICASKTLKSMKPLPKVQAEKKRLLKEHAEDIKNKNIPVVVKIQSDLVKMAQKELEDDPSYELYKSGARGAFDNAYRQAQIMKGPVYNAAKGEFDIMTTSLYEGARKEDLPTMANAVVSGVYPKSIGTGECGYLTKKLAATLQSNVLADAGSDCGSKALETITPFYQ